MGEFKVGIGSDGERPGGVVGGLGGGLAKKAMDPQTFRAVCYYLCHSYYMWFSQSFNASHPPDAK